MGSVFYVMAILGCGDGSTACQEARVEPVQYRTVAECQANLPEALVRNTDLSFPTISASCRQVGTQIARADTRRPRG